MALNEYKLYLVREHARGDLMADAINAGLFVVRGKTAGGDAINATSLSGRVECIVKVTLNSVDPSLPLDILTLAFDERTLEAALTSVPDEFVAWLWQIAESVGPACLFMTRGGDMKYYEAGQSIDRVTFTQLPRLVAHGEVAVVHPIMYFAERLGDGALCRKARAATLPIVEERPGVGCILLLANRDDSTGALEILEPGHLYPRLRASFAPTMYSWRVTKYDPALRDGKLTRQDWTATSDIGKTFAGSKLDRESYLRVEDAYVAAVGAFARDAGVDRLTVTEAENLDGPPDSTLVKLDLYESPAANLDGATISFPEVERVCRLALRSIIWCKLESPEKFFVHFGYDFYMYIGSVDESQEATKLVRELGLFVEPMKSPYVR